MVVVGGGGEQRGVVCGPSEPTVRRALVRTPFTLGPLMFLLKLGDHGIASWLHEVSVVLVSNSPQTAGSCLSLVQLLK